MRRDFTSKFSVVCMPCYNVDWLLSFSCTMRLMLQGSVLFMTVSVPYSCRNSYIWLDQWSLRALTQPMWITTNLVLQYRVLLLVLTVSVLYSCGVSCIWLDEEWCFQVCTGCLLFVTALRLVLEFIWKMLSTKWSFAINSIKNTWMHRAVKLWRIPGPQMLVKHANIGTKTFLNNEPIYTSNS